MSKKLIIAQNYCCIKPLFLKSDKRKGSKNYMKAVKFFALAYALVFTSAVTAQSQDLLFLAENVPAFVNYDGPAAAIPKSQTGMVNAMRPLFGYATNQPNQAGVVTPDFDQFLSTSPPFPRHV